MTERVLEKWTTAEIDAAIVDHRARQNDAMDKGDLLKADDEECWIDRLLDARKYHRVS